MNKELVLGFGYIIIFLTVFIISFIMISESNFSKSGVIAPVIKAYN